MRYRLALIGFGTVAQGLARLLLERGEALRARYGARFEVSAIATRTRGTVYDPQGLDLERALAAEGLEGAGPAYAGSPLELIREAGVDVVVENTPTNLEDGQPALDHVRAALKIGKHVVTANKGPIALAYRQLDALAQENGVRLLFEGTVLSGTPVLNLARWGLAGCRLRAVRGILNGTTNYILSQMEAGMDYDEALAQAQALGYAEADPTADVEGWDALAKVVILANVLMGANLKVAEVARQGITHLTAREVERAKAQGRRWKLIGQVVRDGPTLRASVEPTLLPLDDPLAGVGAAGNALTFETDVLERVTVIGAGAGGPQTGFALLNDLLELHRRASPGLSGSSFG